MSDVPCPIVATTFEQVDGGNFGPHHAFPVTEGPRAPDDPGDQVGLGGTLVGDVPVDKSVEDVTSDVDVDRTAVAELTAGQHPAYDDAVLGEEILDQTRVHVPGTPVGASAKLGCDFAEVPVGEHVTQATDLGRCEPGNLTSGGEGQQSPCPRCRPWPSGGAPLMSKPVDAVRIDQPSTGDLACIKSSVSDELTDAFERDAEVLGGDGGAHPFHETILPEHRGMLTRNTWSTPRLVKGASRAARPSSTTYSEFESHALRALVVS